MIEIVVWIRRVLTIQLMQTGIMYLPTCPSYPWSIPRPPIPRRYYLRFRHSHGATGCGSAHKPFRASRAPCSNPSSTVSPGAYFRYHHQPFSDHRCYQRRLSHVIIGSPMRRTIEMANVGGGREIPRPEWGAFCLQFSRDLTAKAVTRRKRPMDFHSKP
jgi:hypothetical protein